MTRLVKLAVLSALTLAGAAHAFCGFYVSSAGADLFADASMVVLMRDGTRTVLSMQNNYRGPPNDFALVVPVPVVLQKKNVKTLPNEVFARIDTLASPRLVEEYEPGECPPPPPTAAAEAMVPQSAPMPRDLGVKVEAKFDVEEYEIVILSAKDSLGLEIWLKENKYKIPDAAAPLLKPYVQTNWKFFVARVNAKKVKFVNGVAVLSPLRFFYDHESFQLPVRLGLANSAGTQDLIVHVIAKSRYEVANSKNVLVPTNLRVKPAVEPEFGAFYADLLDRTFKATPGAAVTEFSWKGALPPPKVMQSQGIYGVTCDPCPPPVPVDDPLARYLGADVMPGIKTDEDVAKFAQEATITRLHLRYTKESLTDDVVFKAVGPIHGGIPEAPKPGPAKANRFQGRYIMLKPFDQSRCWSMGGMMGGGAFGTPGGSLAMPPPMPPPPPVAPPPPGSPAPKAAEVTPPPPAAPKLSKPIASLLLTDVPELGLKAEVAPAAKPGTKSPAPKK
ncbi:MAG: DUF2330 domain-containing protein [Myxococcota bacterium]